MTDYIALFMATPIIYVAWFAAVVKAGWSDPKEENAAGRIIGLALGSALWPVMGWVFTLSHMSFSLNYP